MTAAEVARKAADLLKRDGWCQGRFRDGRRRCLVAALDDVSHGADIESAVVRFAVKEHTGERWFSDWNDAPERTADEVIALLRQVATELEAS